jgi:hypothetical protein
MNCNNYIDKNKSNISASSTFPFLTYFHPTINIFLFIKFLFLHTYYKTILKCPIPIVIIATNNKIMKLIL